MATIQVIQGAEKGRSFELRDGENIIGRQSRTIQITDGTVSRHHARLALSNGKWMIEDLGSGNGTLVNGVRISGSTMLERGDQIRCGSTLLVFRIVSEMSVDVDEDGNLVDAAIVARLPSNEDSIIIPTLEAGAKAIDSLRVLYDYISEASSIFDVDELLQLTLEKVFGLIVADRGYIMLIDTDGKLTPKASRLSEDSITKDIPISRTIINEVVGKEVGVLSSNAMGDQRFASGKSVHNFGIRSAICVPIKGRERILGVIHVDCSVSTHAYTTEQLRLLTAIGFQTGLAIENVRLYESAVQSERLSAVGETVAMMSHHVKNILQALVGGIDVVEMGLDRNDIDKAKRAWPIVQRNLARINEMVLNMLTLSKDRQPLLASVNVANLLGECLDLQAGRVDQRGIAIIRDMDDMPPIPADESGLRQVFTNLLTNAIDAVEDQQGIVTVSCRFDAMDRQVIVACTDNGGGIDPARLDEIFTPFWSDKGQRGTGLGLSVVKKIVNEHKGDVAVTSTVGEGTTFTVTLPVIQDADPEATATPPVGQDKPPAG